MRRVGWLRAVVVAVALTSGWGTVRAQEAARPGPAAKGTDKEESIRGKLPGRRVGCDVIISSIDRDKGPLQGRNVDMSVVAHRLGTSVFWVEHCMLIYGRRPKRPGAESAEVREERMESLEEDEPEEAAAEDVPEPGAMERPVHPPKERQLHYQPPPTPSWFDRDWRAP